MNEADPQEQYKVYSQLIAKAWSDPEFKARLLAEPEQVIQEAGGTVPAGQRLSAVELRPEETYLVIPPASTPLADEDDPLAAVWRRAATEPAYRERLLRTPAPALAEEGVEIPAGQIVRALEEEDAHGYVFVPTKPEGIDDETIGEDDVAGYFSCCGSGGSAPTPAPAPHPAPRIWTPSATALVTPSSVYARAIFTPSSQRFRP